MNGYEIDAERERWSAVIRRIELRNPPFQMMLRLERSFDGGGIGRLQVVTHVPDRDDGSVRMVVHNHPLPDIRMRVYWDDERRAHWIFDCLVRVMQHELNECFHLDGKRVRDPHANDPSYLRT